MKSTLEARFKKLKAEDEFFTKETALFIDEINKISPGYKDLCKHYADTVKDFAETRDLVIGFKKFLKFFSIFHEF